MFSQKLLNVVDCMILMKIISILIVFSIVTLEGAMSL